MDNPFFLRVKPGDTVLVGRDVIAKVLNYIGGSKDPNAPTLFQIANVDSGEINWVRGEEVKDIVFSYRTKINRPHLFTNNNNEKNIKA